MAIAKSQKSLKDWTEQKWMTSGTHANKKKGSSKEVKSQGKKRYLPEKAWSSFLIVIFISISAFYFSLTLHCR